MALLVQKPKGVSDTSSVEVEKIKEDGSEKLGTDDAWVESDGARKSRYAVNFVATGVNLGRALVDPTLYFYGKELMMPMGWSEEYQTSWITYIQASFYLGQMFSGWILGFISDRWGRRPAMLISVIGMTVGFVLHGLAWDVYSLLAFRMASGLFYSVEPIGNAYITDTTTSEQRSVAMAQLTSFLNMSYIVGPALYAAIELIVVWAKQLKDGKKTFAYKVSFFSAAFITAAASVCAWIWIKETHPKLANVTLTEDHSDENAAEEADQDLESDGTETKTQMCIIGAILATAFIVNWAHTVWLGILPMITDERGLGAIHYSIIFVGGSIMVVLHGYFMELFTWLGMSLAAQAALAFTYNAIQILLFALMIYCTKAPPKGEKPKEKDIILLVSLMVIATITGGPFYGIFYTTLPSILSEHTAQSYMGRVMGYKTVALSFGDMSVILMGLLYNVNHYYPFYLAAGLFGVGSLVMLIVHRRIDNISKMDNEDVVLEELSIEVDPDQVGAA